MDITQIRRCSLEAAVGNDQACPEEGCAFWEPGAVGGGRCAVERLDLATDADLAVWLLDIRARLESASSAEDERALRGAFHHLLNESPE